MLFVSFSLDHPAQRGRCGYRSEEELRRPASDKLKLKIAFSWKGLNDIKTEWEDKPGDFVEAHLSNVVINLIVLGEMRYRLGEQHRHQWLLERKKQLIEEARLRREEEARQARERRIKAEKARVDRLLGEAKALRQAVEIRAYVEEVRNAEAMSGEPINPRTFESWAAWAHAQADRIDPIRSRAYLSGLSIDDTGE